MLSLDTTSAWHTSALLSAAIESATLPSRLKDTTSRDTLGNMTDLLNLHGKQTVANLQMSFSGTTKTPRGEDVGDEPEDGLRLDLDLRPADDLGDGRKQQNGYHRAPKIFSQVLANRGERAGDDEEGDEDEEEDGRIRRRRRSKAISRKFVLPHLLSHSLNMAEKGEKLTTFTKQIPLHAELPAPGQLPAHLQRR